MLNHLLLYGHLALTGLVLHPALVEQQFAAWLRYVEVTAVHNKKGYQEIIESLASTYNFGGLLPNIDVAEYNRNTDRSLILEHHIHKERPLYKKDMDEVLKHMHRLWGYPVILRSVDETGKEWDKMACPPKAANDTGSAPSLGSPF